LIERMRHHLVLRMPRTVVFGFIAALALLVQVDSMAGRCAYAAAEVPTDTCYRNAITISNDTGGTLTNYPVRVPFNAAGPIAANTMDENAWDAAPVTTGNQPVPVMTQSLTSEAAGWWMVVPEITDGTSDIFQLYYGSNGLQRDNGVYFNGSDFVTIADDADLNIADMFSVVVDLRTLSNDARDESIVERYDSGAGWSISFVDDAGSLVVRCAVDAVSTDLAWNVAWNDTPRQIVLSLDSLGDGLSCTETVSGTTSSVASGPSGTPATDIVMGVGLTQTTLNNLRLLDTRVRMSSLGVPTVIIDRFVLGAASASQTLTVDTSNLPFTARHLVLSCSTAAVLGTPNLVLRINGDSGAAYNYQTLTGAGAVAAAAVTTGATSQAVGILGTTANIYAVSEVLFPDALSTRSHKASIVLHGNAEAQVATVAARYQQSLAIVSVTVFTSTGVNLAAGSLCELSAVDERYAVDEQILTVAGTFDFTNVPITNGYNVVIGNLRGAEPATSDTIEWEFNGDTTTANYARQRLTGNNAATAAASASDNLVGITAGDTATAGAFGALLATWQNGYIAQNDPHYTALSGFHETGGPTSEVDVYSGRRNNVERIQSLELLGTTTANFVADSMATLYFVPMTVQSVVELDAAAASITFTGVESAPAARVSLYARTDRAAAEDGVNIAFNGDTTTANYSRQVLLGSGAGVTASQTAANRTPVDVEGDTATANIFGGGTLLVPNFASDDRHKSFIGLAGQGAANEARVISQRWRDTDPITDITFTPFGGANFLAGTVAMLETVDGFGTLGTWTFDADICVETFADAPNYNGTCESSHSNAYPATYTFDRAQAGITVNVGPTLLAASAPIIRIGEPTGDPLGDVTGGADPTRRRAFNVNLPFLSAFNLSASIGPYPDAWWIMIVAFFAIIGLVAGTVATGGKIWGGLVGASLPIVFGYFGGLYAEAVIIIWILVVLAVVGATQWAENRG